MPRHVLIVEDDENIAELLTLYLEKEGFHVAHSPDGREGLNEFLSGSFELVLLDVMLPSMDGWSVLRGIREQSKVPVIMITAKGETSDKVSGLSMGADDYIVKPFEMKEVIARVHAVLRRYGPAAENKRIAFDRLMIDLESYVIVAGGQRLDAPPKEIELLFFLATSPGRVYTRNQLLDEVWGFDYFGDSRTVDVHIKRLREKLSGISDKWELKTVWGVGYKFELIGEQI